MTPSTARPATTLPVRLASILLVAPLVVLCCQTTTSAQFGFYRHNYAPPILGAYGYGFHGHRSISVSTPWASFHYERFGRPGYFHEYHHHRPFGYGHLHGVYMSPFVNAYPSTVVMVPPPVLPQGTVVQATVRENNARWNGPLDLQPEQRRFRRPKPSTPAAKQKALRNIRLGDAHFRNGSYLLAHSEYRKAAEHAEDMAAAQVRLGIVLTSLRRFTLAVKHFKRAVDLDPNLPTSGDSLSTVYGAGGDLNKAVDLRKATDWVREDMIDSDRLFLLGVLLYFDDSTDKAQTLFEAALRLSGQGEHLKAFLRPEAQRQGQQPPANLGPILGQPQPAQPNNVGGNPLGPAPQVPPLPPLPMP